MSANPLKSSAAHKEIVIPPQGQRPEDKAARQRFWIERGNQKLAEEGLGHLHWACVNGHYFIEDRMEAARRALIANPNRARAA